jgi:hypothetical protein
MTSSTRSPGLATGKPDRRHRFGSDHPLALVLAGLLPSAAAVGCSEEPGGGPLECGYEYRELAASDVSSLGFSADAVLGLATPPTRASLDWRAGGPASDTPDPPGLELQVTPAGAGARERVAPLASICPPRLEADVEVSLATTDSSLSGTFAGTLIANTPGSARLLEDVSGRAVTTSGFGIDAAQVAFDAVFTPLGAYGGISIEGTAADAAVTTWYARFPDTRGCSADPGWHGLVISDDADLGGFDAGSSLALVTSHLPTRVVWNDLGEAALALSVSAAGPPCATLETLPSSRERWSLSYPITLDAASEDGRWSGRYSGIVSAEPLDGGFVLASLRVRVAAPPSEFASAAGVPSIDVGAFESGVLDIAIDVDSARGAVRGELDIAGMQSGSCLPNPEEPPAPGHLYGPCEDRRRDTVLRGTFGG